MNVNLQVWLSVRSDDIKDTRRSSWRKEQATKKLEIQGDPKTRNGGMTERRNGGKLPQILKRGMAENHPKS